MSTDTIDGPSSKKRRKVNSKEDSKTTSTKDAETTVQNVKIRKNAFPKFRLKTSGETASLSTPTNERIPLLLTDVQYLLLHSLLGNLNLSQSPRWYVLEKCNKVSQTTCLILEGVSIHHWEKYNDHFVHTKKLFNHYVETITPSVYNGSLVQELALVPLSESEKDNIIQKYGSMNLALEVRKDLMVMMKAVFPIQEELNCNNEVSNEDQFPRTQLILSAWQLIEEGYPVPLKGRLKDAYSDYVMTKDEYQPVTSKSPMIGLDCEMCLTNAGSELTRVSLVNEKHEIVYESLVKPYNKITDYLTRFSGITQSKLQGITKRLEDVQNDIRELLPSDAILIGQSLNIDLHALKMMHPYIIDTSLIFNITGERSRKSKLKVLVKEFLNEDIQSGKNGHCSVEDSIASLKLVQLKLSKTLEYGDAVHTNRQEYKKYVNKLIQEPHYGLSIFNHILEQKITSMVIGCDNITGDYHTYLTQAKDNFTSQLKKGKPKRVKLNTVDDNQEVISKLTEAVKEYNFAMAHLKLEMDTDTEVDQVKTIDKWVDMICRSLNQSSLFVLLFGGTNTDNGVVMARVKCSL